MTDKLLQSTRLKIKTNNAPANINPPQKKEDGIFRQNQHRVINPYPQSKLTAILLAKVALLYR